MAKTKYLVPIGAIELLKSTCDKVIAVDESNPWDKRAYLNGIEIEESQFVDEPKTIVIPDNSIGCFMKQPSIAFGKSLKNANIAETNFEYNEDKYKAPTMRSNIRKGKRKQWK